MSEYSQLLQRVWDNNILFSALVELTYRCNLDCFFCYNDLSLKGRNLTTDQYFQFFEDLKDMSTPNLSLTGGEPLTHPEFFKLGRRARELGFVVRIKSNGHAVTGKLARRIRDQIDPFMIELSLHGARAATHDRQTRVPGSFTQLLSNIPEMLNAGLRIKLNSTLTRWNEQEIEQMFDLADGFGLRLDFDTQVTPKDDGDREPLSIMASREGVLRLLRICENRSKRATNFDDAETRIRKDHAENDSYRREKHCGSGSSSVTVDPYGNVYPCVQWRQPVGNLHEEDIKQIWSRSPGLQRVRETTKTVKAFTETLGPHGDSIGFCPALAWQQTGSPTKLYPAVEQLLDAKKRLSQRR